MDETAPTIQECRRAECRLWRPRCMSEYPMYSRLRASLAYSYALGPMDCLLPADYKNAKAPELTGGRPEPMGDTLALTDDRPGPTGDMPGLTDDRPEPMGERPGLAGGRPEPGLRLCC